MAAARFWSKAALVGAGVLGGIVGGVIVLALVVAGAVWAYGSLFADSPDVHARREVQASFRTRGHVVGCTTDTRLTASLRAEEGDGVRAFRCVVTHRGCRRSWLWVDGTYGFEPYTDAGGKALDKGPCIVASDPPRWGAALAQSMPKTWA